MKRTICVLLAVMQVMMLVTFCLAEEQEVGPEIPLDYTHTINIVASISLSGSTATSSGRILPRDGLRTSITVKLQRSSSGTSGWTTIGTWSGSSSGGASEASGSKTVSKGYYYRTYVVGKVYDSAGSVIETVTQTSTKKHY